MLIVSININENKLNSLLNEEDLEKSILNILELHGFNPLNITSINSKKLNNSNEAEFITFLLNKTFESNLSDNYNFSSLTKIDNSIFENNSNYYYIDLLNDLKNFKQTIESLIITEQFYDKSKFNQQVNCKMQRNLERFNNKDNECNIFNIKSQVDIEFETNLKYEIFKIFYDLINNMQIMISDKFCYFKNRFDKFKSNVVKTTLFVQQKLDLIYNENIFNSKCVNSLNCKIDDYVKDIKTTEKNYKKICNNYENLYSIFNLFLLKISDLNLIDMKEIAFDNYELTEKKISKHYKELRNQSNKILKDNNNNNIFNKYLNPDLIKYNLELLYNNIYELYLKKLCFNCSKSMDLIYPKAENIDNNLYNI